MLRILKIVVAGSIVLLVAYLGGLWSGVELEKALNRENSIPSRLLFRLEGLQNQYLEDGKAVERAIMTNRLRLREQVVYLPREVEAYAGGVTVVGGDEVLFVDRRGKFYSIRGDKVRRLKLSAPENGFAALSAQMREGRFGAARVNLNWHRYNDVLHLGGSGSDHLVISYSDWDPDAFCIRSALARLDLQDDLETSEWRAAPEDWEVVYRTEPCLPPFETGQALYGLEAGGRMIPDADGKIIWTTGSYERDDREPGPDFSSALSQREGSDYGRVLRVDIHTGASEALAKGLRNPQGVARDTRGRIWVTDHGMRGGDELNLVKGGENFGFPAVTYGTRYNREPAGAGDFHKGHAGYDRPKVAFVPSIAPGTALGVRGFHPSWDGDVLVGGFNRSLYRAHIAGEDADFVEPIEIGARIRDLDQTDDGRIVIWTDDRRIFYLSPDSAPSPVAVAFGRIEAIPNMGLRGATAAAFDQCLHCHSLSEGDHGAGPSQHEVCGRRPGRSDFDAYSGALASVGEAWSRASVAAYIRSPETFASGTSMMSGGIDDARVAEEVAAAICP